MKKWSNLTNSPYYLSCSCTGEVGVIIKFFTVGFWSRAAAAVFVVADISCSVQFHGCALSHRLWLFERRAFRFQKQHIFSYSRGWEGLREGGWCVRASHGPADRPQIAAQPATFTGSASFSLSSHSPSVQVSFSTWKVLFKCDTSVQIAFQTVV